MCVVGDRISFKKFDRKDSSKLRILSQVRTEQLILARES